MALADSGKEAELSAFYFSASEDGGEDMFCAACGVPIGFQEDHGSRRDEDEFDPESKLAWGSIYRASECYSSAA